MLPEERNIEQLEIIAIFCRRALRDVERFGNSFEVFVHDEAYQDATSLCIVQIGEAVNRLSDDFKNSHPDIKWYNIYGMRNHLVHGYGCFDTEIAWDALTNYIPELLEFCESRIK